MPIAVLEKSFRALEAMSERGKAISLKDLVAATGVPKPTAHRILQTLAELGYVGHDAERHDYQLTPRLLRLTRGASFSDLVDRALPAMQALHERFNETVNLGVLHGQYVHYVHAIETTRNLRWQVKPGERDPYYSTALGRAIVARLPEKDAAALIAATRIEPRTPHTVRDRAGLAAAVAQARAKGLAVDDQENDLGVVCLGVPLDNELGLAAAISVSVPKGRMTADLRRRIAEALLKAGNKRRQ